MRVSRLFSYLLLFTGIALLGCVVWKVGVSGIRASLHTLGPWLLPFVLLDSVSIMLHSAGWAACFVGDYRRLRLWQLMLVRMAGSAINQVTPTADIGGEVVKVLLLQSAMPKPVATAAVLIDKAGSALAQMAYLIGGTLVLIGQLPLSVQVRQASGITLGLLTLGLMGFIGLQRYGGLSRLMGLLSRLNIGRSYLERARQHLITLETQWVTYYTNHPWRFVRCVVFHFLGFAFDAIRTYILLRLLLGERAPGWLDALMVAVAVAALQQVFFFVPGNIGTLEGIRFTVLSAFDVAEVYGLAFGLVARLENLCWNGLGLLAYTICTRWPALLTASGAANPIRVNVLK